MTSKLRRTDVDATSQRRDDVVCPLGYLIKNTRAHIVFLNNCVVKTMGLKREPGMLSPYHLTLSSAQCRILNLNMAVLYLLVTICRM